MSLPVAFDAVLARELTSQIDGCEFRTVKRYFRSPTNDIRLVVLVTPPYALAEVAAVFAASGNGDAAHTLQTLLSAGVLTFGVDDLAGVMPGHEAHAVRLDCIEDARACRVIYLPPCYVVQLAPQPRVPCRGCRQQENP